MYPDVDFELQNIERQEREHIATLVQREVDEKIRQMVASQQIQFL